MCSSCAVMYAPRRQYPTTRHTLARFSPDAPGDHVQCPKRGRERPVGQATTCGRERGLALPHGSRHPRRSVGGLGTTRHGSRRPGWPGGPHRGGQGLGAPPMYRGRQQLRAHGTPHAGIAADPHGLRGAALPSSCAGGGAGRRRTGRLRVRAQRNPQGMEDGGAGGVGACARWPGWTTVVMKVATWQIALPGATDDEVQRLHGVIRRRHASLPNTSVRAGTTTPC